MTPRNTSPERTGGSSRLLGSWKQDLLSSLVVFLVALPLCMGIAVASGAPIAAGLITGIIGGILVGSLAGSPLQVSGPAAGLTVICGEVIRENGMSGLGLAVILAGLLQLTAGMLRLGQWFRAVSPAVIHGMLTGIGILILTGQLHVLVDDRPRENAVRNIAAIPESLGLTFATPLWEDRPVRLTRIELLRRFNSILDRQRTLQRSVDRSLRAATQGLQESVPIPAAIAATQRTLLDEVRAAAEIIRTSPLGQQTGLSGESLGGLVAGVDKALSSTLADLQRGGTNSELRTQLLQQSFPAAVGSLRPVLEVLKSTAWAGKLGGLAVVIIFLWQLIARGPMKLVPGPLLAILITTAIAQVLAVPVLFVDVPDSLMEGITLPSASLFEEISLRSLLISGLVMAAVASAETLLCATAVDQMHSGPRTRYDRELVAQGIGNTVCGFLGVLPMTGVIVRSAANVQAGGKTRLAAILHGCWLVLFTLALTPLLRTIPVAALAGILVYTGFRLIDRKGFAHLWRTDRSEAMIFLATVTVILVEDLLLGVVTGIVLASLKLLLTFSKLEVRTTVDHGRSAHPLTSMSLTGAATFLRLPVLASQLEKVPAGSELHVDLSQLTFVDHACLELLMNWAKQHSASGGQLVMDWDSLHARFREPRHGQL